METLTSEQAAAVQSLLAQFAQRLLPAKLRNTHRNGRLLAEFLHERGLPTTADNLYDAAKAIYATLDWEIPPAKLVLESSQSLFLPSQSEAKMMKPFTDAKKAAEIADAKAKADAASIAQAKELIAGYLPTKSTPMGERIDYADQALMQKEWAKALNQAIAGKRNMQEWVKALAETIQKRYADRERASERL